ncbi:MAG: hypothetical protein WDM86_07025 [Rhizomicrobium sp.]
MSRMLLRGLVVAAFSLGVGACAHDIGTPQTNIDTIQTLRKVDLAPMAVGSFVPGPKVSTGEDRSTTIRAINEVTAPGGTFSGYLKTTFESELRAAGRFDPNATLVLSGVLTDRSLDSAIGTGTASLAATITLSKDGKTVFEKPYRVDAKWDSSFLGAIAIPDAINNFTGLFDKLATKVLTDPELAAAAR